MTSRRPLATLPLEFEVFGTALGAGLVAGALSLIEPFLAALTATLVALSLAGWCSSLRRRGSGRAELVRPDRVAAFAALGAGAIVYAGALPMLGSSRGLLLVLALLPLWLSERRRPWPRRPGTPSE